MKRFTPMLLLLVCFSGVLVSGCATLHQEMPQTQYYTFDYPPPPENRSKELSATIRIERFQISPEYDTDRIVYSSARHHRATYSYHRWQSNPRDLITYYLTRDFSRSGRFKGVFFYQSLYAAAYTIAGTIDDLYEFDGDPWEAVLTLRILLLKEEETDQEKRIIFQEVYPVRAACKNNSPQSFVQAMGNALAEASEAIVDDVTQRIAADIKEYGSCRKTE